MAETSSTNKVEGPGQYARKSRRKTRQDKYTLKTKHQSHARKTPADRARITEHAQKDGNASQKVLPVHKDAWMSADLSSATRFYPTYRARVCDTTTHRDLPDLTFTEMAFLARSTTRRMTGETAKQTLPTETVETQVAPGALRACGNSAALSMEDVSHSIYTQDHSGFVGKRLSEGESGHISVIYQYDNLNRNQNSGSDILRSASIQQPTDYSGLSDSSMPSVISSNSFAVLSAHQLPESHISNTTTMSTPKIAQSTGKLPHDQCSSSGDSPHADAFDKLTRLALIGREPGIWRGCVSSPCDSREARDGETEIFQNSSSVLTSTLGYPDTGPTILSANIADLPMRSGRDIHDRQGRSHRQHILNTAGLMTRPGFRNDTNSVSVPRHQSPIYHGRQLRNYQRVNSWIFYDNRQHCDRRVSTSIRADETTFTNVSASHDTLCTLDSEVLNDMDSFDQDLLTEAKDGESIDWEAIKGRTSTYVTP